MCRASAHHDASERDERREAAPPPSTCLGSPLWLSPGRCARGLPREPCNPPRKPRLSAAGGHPGQRAPCRTRRSDPPALPTWTPLPRREHRSANSGETTAPGPGLGAAGSGSGREKRVLGSLTARALARGPGSAWAADRPSPIGRAYGRPRSLLAARDNDRACQIRPSHGRAPPPEQAVRWGWARTGRRFSRRWAGQRADLSAQPRRQVARGVRAAAGAVRP